MVFPKARLVVSGLLFLAWLGYLGYLVAVTRDLVVVARPQILVADLCVVAKIEEQEGRAAPRAKVTKVLWSAQNARALVDTTIELPELAELSAPQGWAGADDYLLALSTRTQGKTTQYELTPLPPMPGFHATRTLVLIHAGDQPERLAERIRTTLDIPAERAKTLVSETPSVLKRFVSLETAFKLHGELKDLGADVDFSREHETRIYRATGEALHQFRTIKPNE